VRPCPVCGSDQVRQERRVVAQQVWDALHDQFGTVLPEAVRVRHAPKGEWRLVTCAGCGLEHFPDAPQGDEEFYRLLTSSPRYYESERWEFSVVRRRLSPGQAVVDIGCGDGGFLLSLSQRLERTGVDHNAPALAALQARDPSVRVVHGSASEHAEQLPGAYDIVTAFQILEHVEQPRELLSAARRLIGTDGRVYVSVPHRDRSGRPGFEVLDHPPHHVSR
jgi:2-polyprenyl-3-methyl-5-hydroxy-6-metoxy-1,4-benzoquinol methylase